MIQQAITRAPTNGIEDLVNQQKWHLLHLNRLRVPHPHADASIVLLRPVAALPESREQVAVSVFLVPQIAQVSDVCRASGASILEESRSTSA